MMMSGFDERIEEEYFQGGQEYDLFNFDIDCEWLDSDVTEVTTDESDCISKDENGKTKAVKSRSDSSKNLTDVMKNYEMVVKRKYSRRKPDKNALYAFPRFDQSDSLLYFPMILTRYLNSSDFQSIAKLVHSHFDRRCTVGLTPVHNNLDARGLIRFHELLDELHPDHIACIHHTRVVGNQIIASMYRKFTASRAIYEAVARSTKDKVFAPILCQYRIKHEDSRLIDVVPDKEEAIEAFMRTHDNVLAYMHIGIVLTIDEVTKKITALEFRPQLTSVHASDLTLTCAPSVEAW